MKTTRIIKITFCLLFIFGLNNSFSQNKEQHIGHWKGEDNGDVGYIDLASNGFAYLLVQGKKFGGETFDLNGHVGSMTYETSYSKEGNTIDFIVWLKDEGTEVTRLPGIFKFDKDGKMTLCLNFDDKTRPTEYTESATITLHKVENKQDVNSLKSEKEKNQHIGHWTGEDKGDVGYIDLDSSGYAYFLIQGKKFGGESFEMGNQIGTMTFETNYSGKENTIDFIVWLKEEKTEIKRLLGIFKFDQEGKMILCLNFDGNIRPTEYTEKGTITLHRVKNKQ